jgi:hypothetical protein
MPDIQTDTLRRARFVETELQDPAVFAFVRKAVLRELLAREAADLHGTRVEARLAQNISGVQK